MATIKVIYNSIARRFNITPSTTWDELESKFRSLYNIPTTSTLTATYTDEDNDVITLSSDLELKEVLSQHSSGRPLKLVLNSVNNGENWVIEDGNDTVENKLSNVKDLQQNQIEEEQTTEREDENVEPRYQHVSISEEEEEEEPEHDQSTPLLNKEKEKESEKQHPERTKDTEKENKENKEDEGDEEDEDDITFIISNPWASPTFFGSRFGPGFGLFDGPLFSSGLFGNSRHCPFSPFGRSRPAFFNGYGGPSAYHFGSRRYGPNECGQKSYSYNGSSRPSCCSKTQQQSVSCAEASTSAATQSAKNNRCDKNNCNRSTGPSCNRNFNFFHPRYYNQTSLTQEQLNDKLSILHSMGFDSSNNALYEDLLKRYNGNLERVIELLLRNQQINEHFDNEKAPINESKKQNGIVINEEKSEKNGEIKQVDNEENKPYIL